MPEPRTKSSRLRREENAQATIKSRLWNGKEVSRSIYCKASKLRPFLNKIPRQLYAEYSTF
eukprot:5454744-Pleurochrysis_carterae.AAC.1